MTSVNCSVTKMSVKIAPPKLMYGPAIDMVKQGQQVALRIRSYWTQSNQYKSQLLRKPKNLRLDEVLSKRKVILQSTLPQEPQLIYPFNTADNPLLVVILDVL